MSVFTSAYETTACTGFVIGKITHALEEAMVRGGLRPDDRFANVLWVVNDNNNVPAFLHPISFVVDGNLKVFVDMRPFTRLNQNNEIIVSNMIEGDMLRMRAALEYIWRTERVEYLRDVSPLAVATFASWISENVRTRYALNPGEQQNLSILAGIFYYTLFDADNKFGPQERDKIAATVAKATRSSVEDVYAVVDQLEAPLTTLADFCAAATIVVGTVRLENFNQGVLFSILKNTWYGYNAQEILAVGIEHPPTWLAVIFTAINERTYKNSGVSRILERSQDQLKKTFTASVVHLCHDFVDLKDNRAGFMN